MSKKNTLDSGQLTDPMYYILLSLCEARHGYSIMQFTSDLSKGVIAIGPGTLYTLLKKLQTAKLIQLCDSDGSRQKTYLITEEGMQCLQRELKRREAMVIHGQTILKGL